MKWVNIITIYNSKWLHYHICNNNNNNLFNNNGLLDCSTRLIMGSIAGNQGKFVKEQNNAI